MKRRSARPFTVEVKHTRTSRVALVDATTRPREHHDLWWDIPAVTADKPTEPADAPVVPAEPARPEAPARRVLPSLVPMFSTASEPEAPEEDEAPTIERLPRVRRVKTASKRAPKPAAEAVRPVFTPAPAIARQPTSAPAAATAAPAQPAAMPVRPIRLSRQGDTLKAGERWKRRLPRHLW
ncbi:hypothetical protein [Methylobacterium pseudosasicola]|uniref:Uncharacterized protein n=1 Tax=Methylobacterium pseudosasicola TaxID=582667 RepID=A0A1I4NMP6_9HYPH|nr:hypothetical protein [Methylobacterium pseudosasicola]SFM16625.1 hypothetical protein SAMN05192568_102173 [Methylobacterium pseudosasicola]